MRNYYITQDGKGYAVMHRTVTETERHTPVAHFGNRKEDAIAFRDGCEEGHVPADLISCYEEYYKARPMKYVCVGYAVPQEWEGRP